MNGIRWLAPSRTACPHVAEALPAPNADHCQGCGSRRSLRMCATCGHVGCCESQAGDARRHSLSAGHPVIVSMPVHHGFIWCYEDRRHVG